MKRLGWSAESAEKQGSNKLKDRRHDALKSSLFVTCHLGTGPLCTRLLRASLSPRLSALPQTQECMHV